MILRKRSAQAPLLFRRPAAPQVRRPLLDAEDRAVLAQVVVYVAAALLVLGAVVLLGATLGMAVHAYHWAGG